MRDSTKYLILMGLGLVPLAGAFLLLPVHEINVGFGVSLTALIEVLAGIPYILAVKGEVSEGDNLALDVSAQRRQARELELRAALEARFPDAQAIRSGRYDWTIVDKQTGMTTATYTGRQVLELLGLL
jgi:hypothetical protein